jgi:type III secretion system low calcium response chaperone LcrH/SycD
MQDPKLLEELKAFFEDDSAMKTSRSQELSGDAVKVLYAMAYQLYRNGKYSDAKQFFRYLTLTQPEQRHFWMGLAACQQMLKEYNQAIESYSVAAIQEPNDPYVHWYAADCFWANGQLEEGHNTLKSAISTAKKDSKHHVFALKLELIQHAWMNGHSTPLEGVSL